MIKNAGLGMLAEVASGQEYYPVKKRGERRQLNPNWGAIAWLEAGSLADTEIVEWEAMGPLEDCLDKLISQGVYIGVKSSYTRPMFEVLYPGARFISTRVTSPCPDCDDFSRTSRCPVHRDIVPLRTGPAGHWRATPGDVVAAYEQIITEEIHYQTSVRAVDADGNSIHFSLTPSSFTPRSQT